MPNLLTLPTGAAHAVVVEVLLLAPVSDSLELLAGGPPQVSAAC
jgi:hypothetical protein